MSMTDLDKAWREFTDEVAKALRIPAMLDWLSAVVARHPWIERIPAPPKWFNLTNVALVGIGLHLALNAYLIGYGR